MAQFKTSIVPLVMVNVCALVVLLCVHWKSTTWVAVVSMVATAVAGIPQLFITVALAYTGGLQGTGDTKSPFYISLVSQVALPIGICAIVQSTGHLTPAWIWTSILVGHATRCTLSVLRFRQGKWRFIQVKVEPAT